MAAAGPHVLAARPTVIGPCRSVPSRRCSDDAHPSSPAIVGVPPRAQLAIANIWGLRGQLFNESDTKCSRW
jgi:hypothetical protein